MHKFKVTEGQKEVFDVLAHMQIALQFEKNIPAAAGFFQFQFDNALSKRQQNIWTAYQEHTVTVKDDLLAMFEKEACNNA